MKNVDREIVSPYHPPPSDSSSEAPRSPGFGLYVVLVAALGAVISLTLPEAANHDNIFGPGTRYWIAVINNHRWFTPTVILGPPVLLVVLFALTKWFLPDHWSRRFHWWTEPIEVIAARHRVSPNVADDDNDKRPQF
ncbi:hypothetical protein [Allorhodopirellula heiligendammensis]|uniref:Uncharacterized protein n=1 Tax=Allorhodopirellula heiligendammensis TaxID=2714739 RepID=A0A5C6C3F2_9BACT|nr:hypothetical protein [Allorhodopirellula heiligendammensis]TWU18547.1 hypothetical protein Poly21_07110 [Allorhodopirellula heiligendammensis]